MKQLKIIWLKIQLLLLRVTAHEHSAQWLQLLWAAIEKIFRS